MSAKGKRKSLGWVTPWASLVGKPLANPLHISTDSKKKVECKILEILESKILEILEAKILDISETKILEIL